MTCERNRRSFLRSGAKQSRVTKSLASSEIASVGSASGGVPRDDEFEDSARVMKPVLVFFGAGFPRSRLHDRCLDDMAQRRGARLWSEVEPWHPYLSPVVVRPATRRIRIVPRLFYRRIWSI